MIAELLPLLPALLAAGVLAGFLAGLLGIGGGLVIVPVLFETFVLRDVPRGSAMSLATGTSLAIIVPTAISSTRSHWRRGNVDPEILRSWLAPMLLAVIAGAWLAPKMPVEPLIGMFAAFALLVAANTLLRRRARAVAEQLPGSLWQALLAATIGLICVLLGVGAGTLGVAVLTAFSVAMHRAVGTAAALGLVIALPGALVALLHDTPLDAPVLSVGHVSLPAFACVAPLAVLCAPLGVRAGGRISPWRLQQLFAGFLLLVGLRMLSRLF